MHHAGNRHDAEARERRSATPTVCRVGDPAHWEDWKVPGEGPPTRELELEPECVEPLPPFQGGPAAAAAFVARTRGGLLPQFQASAHWASGWYPDYLDGSRMRYYNGHQWTSRTAGLLDNGAGGPTG